MYAAVAEHTAVPLLSGCIVLYCAIKDIKHRHSSVNFRKDGVNKSEDTTKCYSQKRKTSTKSIIH